MLADLRARRRGSGAGESETERSATVSETGKCGWPTFDQERRDSARAAEAVSFWGGPDDVSTIEVRPRVAVAADLVLRQLDPSPLGDAAGAIDELRPLYECITSNAGSRWHSVRSRRRPAREHVHQRTTSCRPPTGSGLDSPTICLVVLRCTKKLLDLLRLDPGPAVAPCGRRLVCECAGPRPPQVPPADPRCNLVQHFRARRASRRPPGRPESSSPR